MGGGLVAQHGPSGLSAEVRVRLLLVHQAEGYRERGLSLSVGYDPAPETPLGLAARVAPAWGGEANSGAEALWGGGPLSQLGLYGLREDGPRIDTEVGYGLAIGRRLVGTPRFGYRTSMLGREYRWGYALGALDAETLRFELGVDAQRQQSPLVGGASQGVLVRATAQW